MARIMFIDSRGMVIELQPGDGSRYKFAVVKEQDQLLIASVLGVGNCFRGYSYNISSIQDFFTRFPELGDFDNYAGTDFDYQGYVNKEKVFNDHYLNYVVEHSSCGKWTALAGILAGGIYECREV